MLLTDTRLCRIDKFGILFERQRASGSNRLVVGQSPVEKTPDYFLKLGARIDRPHRIAEEAARVRNHCGP